MFIPTVVIFFIGLISTVTDGKRTTRQLVFDNSSGCTTPDEIQGECVNIKECQVLYNLLTNKRHEPGVADFLRKSVCGYDNSDPKVCCPRNGPITNPNPNVGRRTTDITPPNNGRDEFPELLSPPQCGKSSSVQKTRIVGGEPATLGAWPWIAALGYRSNRNPTTQWLCGGALVTNRHVITAAHCTKHPSLTLFKVRLGELNLNSNVNDGATPVDINIERAMAHPSYNPQKYTDDIAILRLETTVQFTPLIQPICLPKSAEVRKMNFVNYNLFVAGWGSTKFKGPSATALQEVQVPIVENESCQRAYSSKGAEIISRQLCAGRPQGGQDACQGDSGGPLMMPFGTSYYLVGVVSYGFRCAEPGFPGIYSRVTSYVNWIAQNLK